MDSLSFFGAIHYIILLCSCFIFLGLNCFGQNTSRARPMDQCKIIFYSTNPNYPPYDWSIDNETFQGASIDLLKEALPADITPIPVVYPWKRALFLAEQGEIDLLVSLRITPERSRYLLFTSHRAFPNPIVLFVRKDRIFPYKDWSDLKNKIGGMSFGDTFGNGFDEYWYKELYIEPAATMEENFKKLESGRIDYFVTSEYVGEVYIATHKLIHKIIALQPPISSQDIHFGLSKKSPYVGLVGAISKNLALTDKKGIPEALLTKYITAFKDVDIQTKEQ